MNDSEANNTAQFHKWLSSVLNHGTLLCLWKGGYFNYMNFKSKGAFNVIFLLYLLKSIYILFGQIINVFK